MDEVPAYRVRSVGRPRRPSRHLPLIKADLDQLCSVIAWRRLAWLCACETADIGYSPDRGVRLYGLCLVGQPGGEADCDGRLGGELLSQPCRGLAEKARTVGIQVHRADPVTLRAQRNR